MPREHKAKICGGRKGLFGRKRGYGTGGRGRYTETADHMARARTYPQTMSAHTCEKKKEKVRFVLNFAAAYSAHSTFPPNARLGRFVPAMHLRDTPRWFASRETPPPISLARFPMLMHARLPPYIARPRGLVLEEEEEEKRMHGISPRRGGADPTSRIAKRGKGPRGQGMKIAGEDVE